MLVFSRFFSFAIFAFSLLTPRCHIPTENSMRCINAKIHLALSLDSGDLKQSDYDNLIKISKRS